jgi:hypothetical protein
VNANISLNILNLKLKLLQTILSIFESHEDDSSDQEPIGKILLNAAVLQELKNLDPDTRRHWVVGENNIFKTLINLLDQSIKALV